MYNSDNWTSEFLSIFVTWQLRVTLDSICSYCNVFVYFTIDIIFLFVLLELRHLVLKETPITMVVPWSSGGPLMVLWWMPPNMNQTRCGHNAGWRWRGLWLRYSDASNDNVTAWATHGWPVTIPFEEFNMGWLGLGYAKQISLLEQDPYEWTQPSTRLCG